jgi:hypothetical protein
MTMGRFFICAIGSSIYATTSELQPTHLISAEDIYAGFRLKLTWLGEITNTHDDA